MVQQSSSSTGVNKASAPRATVAAKPRSVVRRPVVKSVSSRPSRPRPSGNRRGRGRDSAVYVNEKIKAFEVIVVTDEGENLGKMSRYSALSMAQERGLDLVQLSYNPIEKVCTAKMTDFGKYLYEKKKQEKEKKKSAKKGMKQMKFSYGIGDNDLDLKISKIKEMLDLGYSVRVFVQLRGRQNIYRGKAIEKLHYVKNSLDGLARSQSPEPKQDKNTFSYMFNAIKK